MGIALPQVVTSDRASGAQVIDGSLKFDPDANNHLTKTPSGAGNRRTFTLSYWIKESGKGTSPYNNPHILWSGTGTATRGGFAHRGTGSDAGKLYLFNQESNSTNCSVYTNSLHRDFSAWKHIVLAVDTTQATSTDRVKIYINGTQETLTFSTTPAENLQLQINIAQVHQIGRGTPDDYGNYYLSQPYFIDGQALGPESFGYTDPLTNTWRPKKYTNTTESLQPITTAPTLSNGALIIKAKGNSIGGLFESSSGNMNFHSSSDGISWTYISGGTSQVMTAAKYLAVGGSGTNNRTFTPNAPTGTPNEGYEYALWNTNTNFDVGSNPSNTDVTSLTYIDRPGLGVFGTNGFYLPMDGNSPIGKDLSTPISLKNGTVWSSYGDNTHILTAYPWSNAFDGQATGAYQQGASAVDNQWARWTPVGGIIVGSLRINTDNGTTSAVKVKFTGQTVQHLTSLSDGWNSVSGTGTLEYIEVYNTGATWSYLCAVEIDGVILIDGVYGNSWTPVNFGGSVALPKATGARPILNTDGGGNVARPGVFGSEQNVGYAVTVYDDGGGNKYYIDGTKQATLNGLIRGATYTFDTSDSTLGSTHPFRLSATSAHGTEYTDGVVAITGAATTITVPHNAPNSLYYYCTAHSGMGSSITGITTNEKLADPYAWKNVLAFANGTSDISNSINCTSTTKTVTNDGVAVVSTNSEFYGSSLQFESANTDSLTVENADFAMGTGDLTVEFWVYNKTNKNFNAFISTRETSNGTTAGWVIATDTAGDLYVHSGAALAGNYSGDITLPLNQWSHVAYTRASGTHRLFLNGVAAANSTTTSRDFTEDKLVVGDNGYAKDEPINAEVQDVRVYKGVAKYTSNFIPASTNPDILPDTPSGVSGGSKLAKVTDGAVSFDGTGDYLSLSDSADFNLAGNDFTIEAFVYHNSTDYGANGGYDAIMAQWVDSSGSDRMFAWETVGSGDSADLEFYYYTDDGTFHGPVQGAALGKNRWYHVAIVRNGNSMVVYIDGVGGAVTTETDNLKNSTNNMTIGGNVAGAAGYWPGFISNLRFINGTALYTANFTPPSAPLTDVTNTKLLCCQSNTSAIEGAVKPGTITAAGNAAATNFNPFNTDINTVRGQETGYATMNPLRNGQTLSNGNLDVVGTSSWQRSVSTINMSSGKWYWEYKITASNEHLVGVGPLDMQMSGNLGAGSPAGSGYGTETGFVNGTGANGSWTNVGAQGAGDLIGVAFDADEGEMYIYINGDPASGGIPSHTGLTDGPYEAVFSLNGSSRSGSVNFGQKPFKFPPPAGFQPLNAANVRPETVIARPDQYVGVTTYAGDGTSVVVSDYQFKPDFVWIKGYTDPDKHGLYDTVRGATKRLVSSVATEEQTLNGVMSFDDKGFSVGNYAETNGSGRGYVAWSWKAGGNKNTFNVDDVGYASAAAAGLDGGSLAVTGASVGTKQGFSIIKFASGSSGNKTLSHGLLETPTFILVKTTGASSDWSVYHKDLGGTVNNYLVLNTTAANATASNIWGAAVPTSSVFGINPGTTCATSQDVIAYLWHDVPGLQKFGKYTGNQDADGPFIELGFRPKLIICKGIDDAEDWYIRDTTRSPYNEVNKSLRPNDDGAEYSGREIDILSNGFKLRTADTQVNQSTKSYLYAAWAEAPTFNLYGAQSNAR